MAEAPNAYRIEPVHGGYEAQMLYPNGATAGETWHPLNPDGYWSDPDGYSFGLVVTRHVFANQVEAAAAIRIAKSINGDAP